MGGFHPQGSDEWIKQRLGKVTASKLGDAMTNGRGSNSMGATAYSYMYDLIAERLTGRPQDEINSKALEWGNDNEAEAIATYCLMNNVRVVQSGFIEHPRIKHVGGSPDGLVEGDGKGPGGLEIKCPQKSRIHLQYVELDAVPKQYFHQVQGLMWITGRAWWDFATFDPRMPEHLQMSVHREYADQDTHEAYERRIAQFMEQLELKYTRLKNDK